MTPVVVTNDISAKKNDLTVFYEYLENNSGLSQAEAKDLSNIIANVSIENQNK